MRYLIVLIAFSTVVTVSACGLPYHYDSHPDFDGFKNKFEQETGVKVTVPIIYDDLNEQTVALCEIFEDGYRLVRINSTYWTKMGLGGKEETIYHELGHCELNRDHTEDLTNSLHYSYTFPNSIMYPYSFGDTSFYLIFRQHYVEELMFPGKRLEL